MLLKGITLTLLLFITCPGFGQAVTIRISMQGQDDSTGKAGFRVWIKNNAYTQYYVQDTTLIQRYTSNPILNYIWPEFEKKEKEKYRYIQNADGHSGFPIPDSCMKNCCTCTILKKGEQLQFDLAIFNCCTLAKGDYRVKVLLHPLIIPQEAKKGEVVFESNYVYFSIK